jgi:hypothetical protein
MVWEGSAGFHPSDELPSALNVFVGQGEIWPWEAKIDADLKDRENETGKEERNKEFF